jgi:hypothetical protein
VITFIIIIIVMPKKNWFSGTDRIAAGTADNYKRHLQNRHASWCYLFFPTG